MCFTNVSHIYNEANVFNKTVHYLLTFSLLQMFCTTNNTPIIPENTVNSCHTPGSHNQLLELWVNSMHVMGRKLPVDDLCKKSGFKSGSALCRA